jgi:hypothetical protein
VTVFYCESICWARGETALSLGLDVVKNLLRALLCSWWC